MWCRQARKKGKTVTKVGSCQSHGLRPPCPAIASYFAAQSRNEGEKPTAPDFIRRYHSLLNSPLTSFALQSTLDHNLATSFPPTGAFPTYAPTSSQNPF